jgi:outer membrane protein assembly factor BamD
MRTPFRYALLLSATLLLSACGDSDDDDKLTVKNEPPETLYSTARTTFNERNYKKAIEQFEEVERQHPYSEWAPRAEIMAAYAAYRAGMYDDAISILERYTRLHPTGTATAYAYYLRGLSYYNQIVDVGRDQKTTELARNALKDVVDRFPDTEYAQDAKLKLDLTTDHLAGKEMEIGRYYLEQQENLAAINRFRIVVDKYETTSHTPEALHRLVEAYLRLGIVPEAKKYAAVLGHNYPGSEWYQYSYAMMKGNLSPEEKEGSWKDWLLP